MKDGNCQEPQVVSMAATSMPPCMASNAHKHTLCFGNTMCRHVAHG